MLALHQSLWQRANAWNSFETLNRGQFTLSTQLIILNYTVYNLTNLKVLMEWPRSQQLKNQAVMALKTENILKIHKQICQIGKNARSVNCSPLHSCTHVPNISVLCYNYCKTKNQLEIIKTVVFYKKSCNCIQVNYNDFLCMFDTAN